MIAIVGGGISGLALGHQLRALGQQVRVVEAGLEAGGNIRSDLGAGVVTEGGPNGFLDREPATRSLISALGLEAKLREAEPASRERAVFLDGSLQTVPSSLPAFFRSRLLSGSAKLRLALEPFTRRGPSDVDEPLSQFARRHFGTDGARFLDGFQTGVYAGDSERLSTASAFPLLAELDREHRSLLLGMVRRQWQRRKQVRDPTLTGKLSTFEGGMQTLPRALAASLNDNLWTRSSVSSLRRTPQGWTLELAEGAPARQMEATTVVLTVPAFAAALLTGFDPSLSALLQSFRYAPIAAVHLGFPRSQVPPHPSGFGFVVPTSQRRALVGTLFISDIFPWRAPADLALFTCLMGGMLRPDVVSEDDDALLQLAADELQLTLGIRAAPTFRKLYRWPRGIPQYEVGHADKLSQLDTALARWPGLHLSGNAYRGVGVNDCIRNATALAQSLVQGSRVRLAG